MEVVREDNKAGANQSEIGDMGFPLVHPSHFSDYEPEIGVLEVEAGVSDWDVHRSIQERTIL